MKNLPILTPAYEIIPLKPCWRFLKFAAAFNLLQTRLDPSKCVLIFLITIVPSGE